MGNQKFSRAELGLIPMSFGNESVSGFDKVDTGYAIACRIIFPGTDILGPNLSIAKIIAYLTAGANAGSVRVYDETNSQTIVEITGITDVTPTIYDSGALSNLPTGEAIWKIEAQGGSGSTIRLEFLTFCP